MKNGLLCLMIISLFCFAKCNKDTVDSNGLPPATQEGKNTLGFMLNGQPWKPQGVRSTGNLSIDFDPNFNKGIFNIVAYDFTKATSEQFTLGVSDSVNFVQDVKSYTISRVSLCGISFSKDCNLFSKYSDVESSGTLIITRLDRTNRIISGTFNATLSKTGCAAISITDGRFDMKY